MRLQLDSNTAGGIGAGGPGEVGQASQANGPDSGSQRVSGANSGTVDSIQISGASSALNRLASDRTAQIQQLTSAVQSGRYQVSSSLVSNAIVEHAIA
jgi:anti-sigma28 factor (negative regulator of flagellin synthesis)